MQYIAVNNQALSFSTTDKPQLHENQCLIKVKAIGINRADILQKQGKYPPPKGESEILGLEVCGEIVELGSSVTNWQLGQKVFGLVAGGAYAEYVVINADHMMQLPERYSFEQGAAIAETFLTAYQSLMWLGDLAADQKVLIHAGASGVGSAAIQIAKSLNCYVVATVGNDAKKAACIKLGADEVINYKEDDFIAYCKENKHKFNVIVDVIAGDYLNKNIALAALDCRIVILSMLGGRYAQTTDIARMLLNRVHIKASTLRNRNDVYKAKLCKAFWQDFKEQFTTQKITPLIDTVLPWQQCEKAHSILENNENIGKVVLKVD